jgi:hypothetical protein
VSTRRTPAEFFFVHLLLPHPPFEVDPECRFQGGVSPAIEVGRRTAYRWQVICTHRVLARLFDRIDSLYGRRAVIIVHGDHGVRGLPFNATDDRIDRFGALDITTGFSTLLAIRSPTSTGIASREAIPVQDYLWRFIDNGFTRPAVVAWDQFFYSTSIKDPHSQTRHVLSRDQMRWIPRFDQIDSLARVPPPG